MQIGYRHFVQMLYQYLPSLDKFGVIDHVHARVDALDAHAGIRGNVMKPLPGIASTQIIAFPGQSIGGGRSRGIVTAKKLDAEGVNRTKLEPRLS